MKITVKGLGIIRQAELELGELTIICGLNNTGKTYIAYSLYGFLKQWEDLIEVSIPRANEDQLINKGATELNIIDYVSNVSEMVTNACIRYSSDLNEVFASNKSNFLDSSFMIDLMDKEILIDDSIDQSFRIFKGSELSIVRKPGSPYIKITLLSEAEEDDQRVLHVRFILEYLIKMLLFDQVFPDPFILSVERTGVAIFREDLDIIKNRLIEEIFKKQTSIDSRWIERPPFGYALPIKENIDFARKLGSFSKKDSELFEKHPAIIEEFTDIIGGDIDVDKNEELRYIPKKGRVKLNISESSSSIRSLLALGFYLRHIAKEGDLLLIDEPELNLHPENQRRIARLIARMVNIGIKVFITTHSDYIIKELNTLIMLKEEKTFLKNIADKEGYKKEELLSANKVRVYIAEKAPLRLDGHSKKVQTNTLVKVDVDQTDGIEVRSFDSTIEDMNRIQEEIIWGRE